MLYFCLRLALVPAMLVALAGCASSSSLTSYVRDPEAMLNDSTLSIVCLPLTAIEVGYVDQTKLTPERQFNDSFFLEAANSLLSFEVSRRYTLRPRPAGFVLRLDSLGIYEPDVGHSVVAENGTDSLAAARIVRELCAESGADLLLWPYSCVLKHVTFQAEAWRGGGPSYEKPVKHVARSVVHAQIWDREGRLLYERIGASDKPRPALYPFFGRTTPEEDIVRYAKRLFAPPMVRSLYGAVQESLGRLR